MKRIALLTLPVLGGALVAYRVLPVQDPIKFTVPVGFAVEEVYSPARAGSVVAITFDSQGRLVVARENGPVLTLVDTNGDGKIDQELHFTDSSSVIASQGMVFDGPDLLVTGRGAQGTGLYRVSDVDRDGRGDRVELVELATTSIGEHGPHALFFGPDGYVYWAQANFSNIYSTPSPLSPVRDWENASLLGRDDARGFGAYMTGGPGGVFLRKNLSRTGSATSAPNGPGDQGVAAATSDWELVAMGFRNTYDGDFNLLGELFTFDSDMEWHRDLPTYRPTRTVHTVPGGDYGYREGMHVHPAYYFDNLPPVEDQGRGSPTGVAVYNAYNYPQEYSDMVLQADWSRGRIIGTRLTRNGATYRAQSTNFVYGEPLNVTDIEVGPDGNVYFSLGGRFTQGGIYRIVYNGRGAMPKPIANTPLDRVLTMSEPRSAYSRELARSVKEQIGNAAWQQGLTDAARDGQANAERRVRAMELLQVFGPGLDENALAPLARDAAWEVRAATAYNLGLKATPTARRTLTSLLKDADPLVQRRAAEALLRTGIDPTVKVSIDVGGDVMPLLSSPDHFVRYAGRGLLRALNPNLWKEAAYTASGYPQATEALLALVEISDNADIWEVSRLVRRELELLAANPSDAQLLDLVRLIQRTTLKDNGVRNIAAGPSSRGVAPLLPVGQTAPAAAAAPAQNTAYAEMTRILLRRFPSSQASTNLEIARLLAYWNNSQAVSPILAEMRKPETSREQQLQYAELLSMMNAGWNDAAADQMTAWLERAYTENWRGGASFSGSVNRIRDGFLGSLPAARQAAITRRLQAAQPPLATLPVAPGAAPLVVVSDEEVFEEMVYNPNVLQGTPAGGVVAFQRGLCINCHTFGPIGREFGPDLTTVGQRFSRRDLARAIVFPNETVSDLYQVERITRSNGESVSGTIAREDANTLVVTPVGTQAQISISKTQIRSRAVSKESPMPHGLMNLLDSQQRRDLILLLQAGPSAIPDSALSRLGVNR
jgi:putative heme-binding domain-containing protein